MEDITSYLVEKLDKIDTKTDDISKSIAVIESKNEARDNDIRTLKEDIVSVKTEQANIKADLVNIKMAPVQDKADKWQKIADYVFKTIITLVGGAFLWVIASGYLSQIVK